MMHYAKVDGLALENIKNDKLAIRINGVKHTITWHPDHAKTVKKFSSYTDDQKFVHNASYFRLVNLRMSSLNLAVR